MRWGALTALAALLLLPVAAADDRDDQEAVYVYTNVDIEKLDPIPTQSGTPPTAEEIEADWQFVQSVIDDANARIDARRDYELARRRTDAEAGALDRVGSRPRYVLPYNFNLFRYRVGHGYVPYPEHEARPPGFILQGQIGRLWDPPNAALFKPITPIHARPYRTNLFRTPVAR